MELSDFKRLIDNLKRKVFLMIGRGILGLINNVEKTQKIQILGLSGEIITDIERMQEYGFETYPIPGTAEAVVVFQNGNRDQGLAICVADRDKRPLDLLPGEVRMYDTVGNKITLKTTGVVVEDFTGNKIETIAGQINVTGTTVNLLGATEAFVKGTTASPEMIKDQTAMSTLQTAINGWVPVPNDGGAALKAALAAFLALPMADYSNILSVTIKGE